MLSNDATARIVAVSLLLFAVGCSSGPSSLPEFDPSASAAKAMELYDVNSDGQIDKTEMQKAPELRAALQAIDKDSDGKISEDEISEKIERWVGQKTGLVPFVCYVKLDGRQLTGATVKLEPAPFLEGAIHNCIGTTRASGGGIGKASINIVKEERPRPNAKGVQFGLYRVRISKMVNGKETIPSKYNTETILGQEVSFDNKDFQSGSITYKLKSK